MARKSSSTTPTDTGDNTDVKAQPLASLKLVTSGADTNPVTQNSESAAAASPDIVASKSAKTNEEVHDIAAHHDIDFHNNPTNQAKVDQETMYQRSLREKLDDDPADQDKKTDTHRPSGDMLATEAIAALALHLGHHHWFRDIRDALWLKRLAKDTRKVDRAVHDGKDVKKATDAEKDAKDIKDVKTGEQIEHDAKLGEKAGADLGKLGKDARLLDAMKHAEHLGKTFKHVIAIGGIASLGVGGFLLKRYMQGELMRSVAKLELPDTKADEMAWDVSTRTIISRDAQNKLDKGDYTGAAQATIQPKIDDAKDAINYLSDQDKVNKDFAEIDADMKAIMKVYDKDPEKAQQLILAAADQAGLLEGVILKDGKLSAETLHNAFMGNKDGTQHNLGELKTAYLAQPNPNLDKDADAIQDALQAVIKAKPDGKGASMPTITQPKPAGRLAADHPSPDDKLG